MKRCVNAPFEVDRIRSASSEWFSTAEEAFSESSREAHLEKEADRKGKFGVNAQEIFTTTDFFFSSPGFLDLCSLYPVFNDRFVLIAPRITTPTTVPTRCFVFAYNG